jgi:N-acetylneuraminic acid mutarotase
MNPGVKATWGGNALLARVVILGVLFLTGLAESRAQTGPGQALQFDGVASQVQVPSSALLTQPQFTFEAWVNPQKQGCNTIFSRGDGVNANFTDYIFQVGDAACALMRIALYAGGTWHYSSNQVPMNAWTHVAVTYDGATLRFYMNGVPDVVAPQPYGPLASDSPLYIGRQGTVCNCNFFQGLIDEVRIWYSVRTPGQISASMSHVLSGLEPGLVAYYRFDEGSGATAFNSSSGGSYYNGTLIGTVWELSTVPFLPDLLTGTASGITSNSAVLHGTVNPGNLPTSAYFQWGATTNYGNFTATNALPATNLVFAVSNLLGGLSPAAVYHCRLVATNSAGAIAGGDVMFTTPPTPVVTAVNPNTGRTLGGTVVTITGSNFTSATSATFGGTPATTFSVSNSTTVIATTPYRPPGTVNVAVITSLGVTGTGTNLFTYTAIGSMASARYEHTATLLPNGLVLIAGGQDNSNNALASAELYNPATGAWTATASMASARYKHTATLLPNGLVLVAGGQDNSGHALASAELYNPATGTWTATGSTASARYYHTATLLPNSLVLIMGGYGNSGALASAELYNFTTGTWTATASMTSARYSHTTTLLTNGLVLVAGGFGNSSALATAELYNPATRTWTATNSMATARLRHTATLLPNGLVLVAGGLVGSGALASAELYNPATGTWTATGSMVTAHYYHTATLSPNGLVLVAGGDDNSGPTASAELYNPATGTWTATNSLATPRYEPTATLLHNGTVLVAGGYNSDALASAELYNPNPAAGSWTATGSMASGRDQHTATLLPYGKVLVAGGEQIVSPSASLASAEWYDPATGTWLPAAPMASPRAGHTATLLPNGLLLVAGGFNGSSIFASAECFDPATGTWLPTGSMANERAAHTATLLPSGLVLVAGGYGSSAELASAELYNPVTTNWTPALSMANARLGHTATLLPNGKVLVAGGSGLASAELYDPTTGLWTPTGSLATGRSYHTATLLPSGEVLVAGGYGYNASSVFASAELYNPATGTWRATTTSMASSRYSHTATLLPNGLVLVAGGVDNANNSIAAAELYNPATDTWTVTASLLTPRRLHAATLLPNGAVLVAGADGDPTPLTSAELYNVGLGFNAAWQPQIAYPIVALSDNGGLNLNGSRFRGVSSASGGNGSQDSPTSYPLVQVRRLDNEQSVFLLSDPATFVSANSFVSQALPALGQGWAMVTVFANGIPSVSSLLSLPAPGIAVLQPSNIEVGNGGSRTFYATTKTPGSMTFTLLNNNSLGNLTGVTFTTNGANAADFAVTAGPTTPVSPGGTTTFTVQFSPNPSGPGSESASLQLSNNSPGSTPYIINLVGQRLSYTNDSSGDGLSDAAQFDLAPLGFNWQSNQTSLINTLFTYANEIGLYTSNQLQALNVGSPLLIQNLSNGLFTLTIGVQQTTNPSGPFLAFPMNGPGMSASIDAQGRLVFQFPGSNNAAFFRLLSQ